MTADRQDTVQSSQQQAEASMQPEVSELLKRRVEELEALLAETKAQLEKSLNRYKYLQADFENYRKQVAKENERIRQRAVEEMVIELITFKEDLERALALAKDSTDTALLEGLRMVADRMNRRLLMAGVLRR